MHLVGTVYGHCTTMLYIHGHINRSFNAVEAHSCVDIVAKFPDEQYTIINQSTAGRFDPRVLVNCLQVYTTLALSTYMKWKVKECWNADYHAFLVIGKTCEGLHVKCCVCIEFGVWVQCVIWAIELTYILLHISGGSVSNAEDVHCSWRENKLVVLVLRCSSRCISYHQHAVTGDYIALLHCIA